MTDGTQAELRDRLFELWRDGRSDNDRYNSVNAAEEWLTTWHNKQVEKMLDRLESQSRRADECTDDTYVVKMIRVGAERNKLKEGKDE